VNRAGRGGARPPLRGGGTTHVCGARGAASSSSPFYTDASSLTFAHDIRRGKDVNDSALHRVASSSTISTSTTSWCFAFFLESFLTHMSFTNDFFDLIESSNLF
jgi:hypothetical protein